MYIMKYLDNIKSISMTNASPAPYLPSNMLTKWTEEVAKSTTNVSNITFTCAQLTDIQIYNTNAILGTVSVYAAGTLNLVKPVETLDFFNATSIAYAGVDKLTYAKNIRAFHGEQIFYNVDVVISLEAPVGQLLKVGTIGAGVFVKYGDTQDATITRDSTSYQVLGTIAEYYAILNKTQDNDTAFAHVWVESTNSSNLYMGYGKPKLGSPKRVGAKLISYNIEFKA